MTYISCSSDFYTFYVNVPLSLGCMIRKVSAEDIAIRGNGTGLEYMCPTRHFVYIFFNPVFQVSTAKNEINLFNNHVLIVAPVTFAPAGAMTPSAEFLYAIRFHHDMIKLCRVANKHKEYGSNDSDIRFLYYMYLSDQIALHVFKNLLLNHITYNFV